MSGNRSVSVCGVQLLWQSPGVGKFIVAMILNIWFVSPCQELKWNTGFISLKRILGVWLAVYGRTPRRLREGNALSTTAILNHILIVHLDVSLSFHIWTLMYLFHGTYLGSFHACFIVPVRGHSKRLSEKPVQHFQEVLYCIRCSSIDNIISKQSPCSEAHCLRMCQLLLGGQLSHFRECFRAHWFHHTLSTAHSHDSSIQLCLS